MPLGQSCAGIRVARAAAAAEKRVVDREAKMTSYTTYALVLLIKKWDLDVRAVCVKVVVGRSKCYSGPCIELSCVHSSMPFRFRPWV